MQPDFYTHTHTRAKRSNLRSGAGRWGKWHVSWLTVAVYRKCLLRASGKSEIFVCSSHSVCMCVFELDWAECLVKIIKSNRISVWMHENAFDIWQVFLTFLVPLRSLVPMWSMYVSLWSDPVGGSRVVGLAVAHNETSSGPHSVDEKEREMKWRVAKERHVPSISSLTSRINLFICEHMHRWRFMQYWFNLESA